MSGGRRRLTKVLSDLSEFYDTPDLDIFDGVMEKYALNKVNAYGTIRAYTYASWRDMGVVPTTLDVVQLLKHRYNPKYRG